MQTDRIAELVEPFIRGCSPNTGVGLKDDSTTSLLSPGQLGQISAYLDLLLRWNQRINLTAVRDEENIVIRHIGESLFTARHLFPADCANYDEQPRTDDPRPTTATYELADVGSGAGFPGLPIKIWNPLLRTVLIESNHKKATFLREVIRALELKDIEVSTTRAEHFPHSLVQTVTLRAVERFESVLPVAARLLATQGRLALLVGESQGEATRHLTPTFTWARPVRIPLSHSRVLLLGQPQPI